MNEPTEVIAYEPGGDAEPWTLVASSSGLRISSETVDERYDPDRLCKEVSLLPGTFGGPSVVTDLGGKKSRMLELSRASAVSLLRAVGPELAPRWVVGQQMKWSSTVGMLFVVTSVPLFGMELDVVGLALGFGLLGIAGLARLKMTRWLMLVDAVWVLGLTADTVADVARGDSHPAWLVFVFFLLLVAFWAFKTFRLLHQAVRPDPAEIAPSDP